MAQILKFPAQAAKLGYKRVRKRGQCAEQPDQLQLFPRPTAQILEFSSALGTFERALMLDERGDSRAAEFYGKAVEEGDCPADAYCNLGIIESEKGNTAKAFDCFTLALKTDPRHAEAHFNLGNLYLDATDLRLAQLHYELAGQVDPGFANVYYNLALVHAIKNDLAEATKAVASYRQLVPDQESQKAEQLLEDLRRKLGMGKIGRSQSKGPEK